MKRFVFVLIGLLAACDTPAGPAGQSWTVDAFVLGNGNYFLEAIEGGVSYICRVDSETFFAYYDGHRAGQYRCEWRVWSGTGKTPGEVWP